MRLRDLGYAIGVGTPGPWNAITDVRGVAVGHTTLIRGDGPLVVGEGPVRTGVTVILPRPGSLREAPSFVGAHTLNGNGELTGLEWVREAGVLTTPIAITNTHSVGVVRDALVAHDVATSPNREGIFWSMPLVGETYDGILNDIDGQHVTAEDAYGAIAAATMGPVEEGSVGGGTGMLCHEFKGGIGTASRVLPAEAGSWTVGVLVQANYGARADLRLDGLPIGRHLPVDVIPSPFRQLAAQAGPPPGTGSIIGVVATDAPLLPEQCRRLAQRAGLGVALAGGGTADGSGDIFVAFSAAAQDLPHEYVRLVRAAPSTLSLQALHHGDLSPLFHAVVEATQEAILNAMLAADDMTGRDGIVAHGLTGGMLQEAVMSVTASLGG